MKDNRAPFWIGVLLVAMGGLFLLGNLGVLGSAGTVVWFLLFAAAGAGFLYVFISDRDRWWAIIPGFTLLGLAALIGLTSIPFLGRVGDRVGAPIFLASIGLAFWAVYFTRRDFWWAIIPGGVMLSVASLVFIEALNPPFDAGGIILLGIGVTFALVGLVETDHGRMRWAWIPAGVMTILGVLIMAESMSFVQYLWPLIIIGGGLFFVARGWASARKEASAEAFEPTQPASAAPQANESEADRPITKKLD